MLATMFLIQLPQTGNRDSGSAPARNFPAGKSISSSSRRAIPGAKLSVRHYSPGNSRLSGNPADRRQAARFSASTLLRIIKHVGTVRAVAVKLIIRPNTLLEKDLAIY